ncbi:MAG: serine/threonine protein kinase, partial [Kofleriaceae bacterium]|nr:serine/threonine protein kinase [Kofleriaceae bacterium]
MSACLGTDTLLDMIEGRATPEQRQRIEEHASRCAECRRVMSSLAREPSGEESTIAASDLPAEIPRDDLAVGDSVARYVIRARLGAGGMGVVYAALDPELGREVAIKVLSPRLGGSTGRTMFEERLRREARALAQLAHPNVVAIHDVGHVGKRLFIAMELLDGETLAGWCRIKPRSPREILERFLEAGRGLAAAHAAGIVHRDVKPENMMLGKDGRVRVVDFGLARTQDEPGEEGGDKALAAGSDGSLTTPGAVMGTPHYMAPEQHRGETVDARTDQFSFCVALYCALYDVRPFDGEDLESLGRAVESGAVREPPRRRGVPRRIWKALRRGMSPRPADRFPTLDELLAQITPARRTWWIPAVGVVAAGTAATVAIAMHPAPPKPCEGMEQHLAGVWDPARRASLEAAIRRSGSFADATAKTVLARLDDYTSRWVSTRTETCTATRVRREQTDAVMSQRMACLDDRLHEVGALVDTLSTADREGISHAVAATYQLTDLASCADAELLRLRAKPPQDPKLVASVRAKLASARALEVTGKYRDALAIVTGLAPDVTRAAYRPIEAETALVEGLLQADLDQDKAAVDALERAVFAAEASGHDPVAAKALIELVDVRGQHAQFEESDAAHKRATAALERIGRAPELAADLDYVFGVVQIIRGDLDAAEQALTRGLRTAEGIRGAELKVAATLVALGRVGMRRMNGTAEPFLERAKVIEEKLLGPDHPDIAAVL